MKRRSRAQGMVEYALVLPVFIMLVIGVVDFSRAVWAYNTVAFLARDGARFGAVASHGVSATQAHVASSCLSMLTNECDAPAPATLPPSAAGITAVRSPSSCGSTTSPVSVTVTYAFQPASLMIANLWGGGTLPIQATSQMYVESATNGGCAV